MSSILEGELAETISEALIDADIPYAVTITRTEDVGGPPWDPVTEDVEYACQGFTEEYTALELSGTLIQAHDVKVVVLAPTLTITPTVADKVTVRGQTYSIINVSPDPALATIALQARA